MLNTSLVKAVKGNQAQIKYDAMTAWFDEVALLQ